MNQAEHFAPNKNPDAIYCFLDLETTGFDHKDDSIIEVAFILTDIDLNEISRYSKVITPHKGKLTPTVTRITGITPQEIEENGVPWSSVEAEVQALIQDTVIVGHNIDFDIRFLLENNIQLETNKRIDTHELARMVFFGEDSYSLEVLSTNYGFLHTDAHRALSDVEASLDLYKLELKTLDQLDGAIISKMQDVCKQYPQWYAAKLLDAAKKTGSFSVPIKKESVISSEVEKSQEENSVLPITSFEDQNHVWTRITDTKLANNCIKNTAKSFVSNDQKSVIIAPKLTFFEEYKGFPTPEILLDPERLDTYLQGKKHTNGEIAFGLKCLIRHHYGIENLFGMDLFFDERNWWSEINISESTHQLFEKEVKHLDQEETLMISPAAYIRFCNHPVLKDRAVICNEAEVFAENLMLSPTKTYPLKPFLDNEETSVAAHFVVKRICDEIVEPINGKKVGPYPERVPLPSHKSYPEIAEMFDDIDVGDKKEAIKKWFESTDDTQIRWLIYYPDSGNLDLSIWDRNEWKELKKTLSTKKVWWLHRHTLHERNLFGWIFLGQKESFSYQIPDIHKVPELEVPTDLESPKSEAFVPYCSNFLIDLAKDTVKKDHWVVAQSGSIESVKKWFEPVSSHFENSDITVIGERMSGGTGKLLQALQTKEQTLLFVQYMNVPELQQYPFKTLVLQKFPFPAPHPLHKILGDQLDQQRVSWWDVWTIPQLEAQISRTIGLFPNLEKVYFLDTRENSLWGKGILRNIFSPR